MYVCSGNSVSWLKVVALVGIGLWAVPLVWYYKNSKKENQQ